MRTAFRLNLEGLFLAPLPHSWHLSVKSCRARAAYRRAVSRLYVCVCVVCLYARLCTLSAEREATQLASVCACVQKKMCFWFHQGRWCLLSRATYTQFHTELCSTGATQQQTQLQTKPDTTGKGYHSDMLLPKSVIMRALKCNLLGARAHTCVDGVCHTSTTKTCYFSCSHGVQSPTHVHNNKKTLRESFAKQRRWRFKLLLARSTHIRRSPFGTGA